MTKGILNMVKYKGPTLTGRVNKKGWNLNDCKTTVSLLQHSVYISRVTSIGPRMGSIFPLLWKRNIIFSFNKSSSFVRPFTTRVLWCADPRRSYLPKRDLLSFQPWIEDEHRSYWECREKEGSLPSIFYENLYFLSLWVPSFNQTVCR